MCLYISYIYWERVISFKSCQVFYSLQVTDVNTKHFYSSYYLIIKGKPELRINSMVTTAIMDFWFFFSYGMTEYGRPFLKSIISSYELHSFFRYLILKFEKLRQPVSKYTETTTFCRSFPLPPPCSMLIGWQITPRPCWGQITDP